MQTIAIVDYGMGNVQSVQKALEYVAPNQHCILTNNPQIIKKFAEIAKKENLAVGIRAARNHISDEET